MVRKIFLGMTFVLAPFVQAQDEIEEIIVLAQKKEQTLQEVPVAVSVVDAEVIQRSQINDPIDLQTIVPSLQVTQLQSSKNTNFLIRGFGNGANNSGIEPSVGVFVDGVYRSRTFSVLNELPHLERIEVLRGPQSTLFGKNASAGVINIVTRTADPTTMDGPSGRISATVGTNDQRLLRGNFEIPLSDTVGFGLSGYKHNRDGYFTNLVSGNEINDRSRIGVRGELTYYPSDTLSMRLIMDANEIDELCCGVANLLLGPTGPGIRAAGGNVVPDNPFIRKQFLDFDPTNKLETKGISLEINLNVSESLDLTYIVARRGFSMKENVDVDFTSAAILAYNTTDANINTTTHEMRLAFESDRLEWVVGSFFFEEDVTQITDLKYGPGFRPYVDAISSNAVTGTEIALGAPTGSYFGAYQGVLENAGQDDETLSLFAQMDFAITDKLELTVGANYTTVDKSAYLNQENDDVFSGTDFVQAGFAGAFTTLTGGMAPTPANFAAVPSAVAAASALSVTPCSASAPPPGCNALLALVPYQFLPPYLDYPNSVESGKTSDSEVTVTARLAYDVSDTINTYVSYATGYKPTSWNFTRDSRPFARDLPGLTEAGLLVTNITAGTRYAEPEEATVIEVGMKARWDENYLNLTYFNQEIVNFQSNTFAGTAFNFTNAGKQTVDGIEVDLRVMATEALELMLLATIMDPMYDSFVGAEGVNGPEDLSGTQPAGLHERTIITAATYFFELSPSVKGFLRADLLSKSDVQVVENVAPNVASRKVSKVNASIGLSFYDRYDLTLWARNLNEDEYLQSAFPAPAQAGTFSGYPNQPRTIGMTFSSTF